MRLLNRINSLTSKFGSGYYSYIIRLVDNYFTDEKLRLFNRGLFYAAQQAPLLYESVLRTWDPNIVRLTSM